MACTAEEFRDLLSAEMYVDVQLLREESRHGIPREVRGEVWKYLLEISKPDKAEEMAQRKKMQQDYQELEKTNPEISKQVKAEIRRYQAKFESALEKSENYWKGSNVENKFENVMMAYVNHNSEFQYHPGMEHLLGPFVRIMTKESDMYFCFQHLMCDLAAADLVSAEGINRAVARLMIAFRTINAELYNYFEEEELEPNEWAVSWTRWMLCRELPLNCVLRLWDTYFAANDAFALHPYVCLAILEHCQEELLELDHAELRAFLSHLPVMDMDQIVTVATRIRDDVLAHNM